MNMHLKVMADYDCHPLWDLGSEAPSNIDPRRLPISPELVSQLDAWRRAYDDTLNRGDPASSSFPSQAKHESFVLKGLELAKALAEELGNQHQVSYFNDMTGALVPVSK